MESDLVITIKGVPDELARSIGETISMVVETLEQAEKPLDFRRMHRIIVTTDFGGELKELSPLMPSGNPIQHTEEEYAIAVAKVLVLPKDGDYEIVPVINAHMALSLVKEGNDSFDEKIFHTVLHGLHHELCHVHDDNKQIDLFKQIMLNYAHTGKEMFTMPLAEMCWAEYFADRRASGTANEDSIEMMATSFAEAIPRTRSIVNKEIRSYRWHGDLNRLITTFRRHGEFLPKVAAYMLGYVDGLDKPLSELSAEAAEKLSGSYFEPTWNKMHTALQEMYRTYPDEWEGLEVYNDLAAATEGYYDTMGLVLSTTEGGGAYIKVPFR